MIDPIAAWSVADLLAATGTTIAAFTSRIGPLLPEAGQLQLVVRSTGWWEATAADLKRRVAALEPGASPSTGPEWVQGPPPSDDINSPAKAAAFFGALSPQQAQQLAKRFPDRVGSVDGAPFALRYAANHLLAAGYLQELRSRRRMIVAATGTRPDFAARDPWSWFWSPLRNHQQLIDRQLADLDTQISDAERWANAHRQFLRFDPAGDGQIIEVLGRLESARHVAVIVPGVGNEIANYEQGLHLDAAALHLEAKRPDAAVIAWLGYDTPDNLLAAASRPPAEAATSLSKLLAGLDAAVRHDVHTSVIGHSYGSLVTGEAMRAGGGADEVVFIGSPGVGVDNVSQLALAPRTRVWAASAASDPIRLARDIECLDIVPICFPSADRLFFGLDPTDPDFGATTLAVEDAPILDAHSSYYSRGSLALRNLTSIVLGQNHKILKPRRLTDEVSE